MVRAKGGVALPEIKLMILIYLLSLVYHTISTGLELAVRHHYQLFGSHFLYALSLQLNNGYCIDHSSEICLHPPVSYLFFVLYTNSTSNVIYSLHHSTALVGLTDTVSRSFMKLQNHHSSLELLKFPLQDLDCLPIVIIFL